MIDVDHLSFSVLVKQFAKKLLAKKLTITTAESCTGGWIAQALTAEPGSSEWFDSGFITYSNESKKRCLNVSADLLSFSGPGAVSEEVVISMAQGAKDSSGSNVVIAVSGIAGPDGGETEKPVGTIWIAWQWESKIQSKRFIFSGDRYEVRRSAVEASLLGAIELIS